MKDDQHGEWVKHNYPHLYEEFRQHRLTRERLRREREEIEEKEAKRRRNVVNFEVAALITISITLLVGLFGKWFIFARHIPQEKENIFLFFIFGCFEGVVTLEIILRFIRWRESR